MQGACEQTTRAGSVVVLLTLHDDHVLPARCSTSELDGSLDCLCATVPQEDAVQAWVDEGQLGQQCLDQTNV